MHKRTCNNMTVVLSFCIRAHPLASCIALLFFIILNSLAWFDFEICFQNLTVLKALRTPYTAALSNPKRQEQTLILCFAHPRLSDSSVGLTCGCPVAASGPHASEKKHKSAVCAYLK